MKRLLRYPQTSSLTSITRLQLTAIMSCLTFFVGVSHASTTPDAKIAATQEQANDTHFTLPIEHWQQDSGAQIWMIHSPSLPMLDVQIAFDGGARRDPKNKIGLANATANLMNAGIAKNGQNPALDENQLLDAWADLGSAFYATSETDQFNFALRSLTEKELLDKSLELASQQIAFPSWPKKVWKRELANEITSLNEAKLDPSYISEKSFSNAIYRDHAYGQFETAESLKNIQIVDMQQHHKKYIVPCRAKVSIVGDIERQQADALVKKLLSKLPQNPQCEALSPVQEVQSLTKPNEIRIPFDSTQTHILVGQPGIRRSDPDYLAFAIANYILGGGGFQSILMQELRTKKGLTYDVSSQFSPSLHAAPFVIHLKTRNDQADNALQIVRQILRDFYTNGPTQEQMNIAKANLIGGYPSEFASNENLLSKVQLIANYDLPLDYNDTWTSKVQAVTREDTHRAIQRILNPDAMVEVLVGKIDNQHLTNSN